MTRQNLQGLTFCFTGELDITRREAEAMVIEHGGTIAKGVSKNTHIVVVGKNPGSKINKMFKTGTCALNQQTFFKLLKRSRKSVDQFIDAWYQTADRSETALEDLYTNELSDTLY